MIRNDVGYVLQHMNERTGIDWDNTIKLAIVVSIVAALLVVALGHLVAEPILIVGIILGGSTLGWRQSAPKPLPVRSHRR